MNGRSPCRDLYARLLRLYPKPYRERFGEGMEQTFNDLLRDRRVAGSGSFGFVLWVFVETSAGILREDMTFIMTQSKNVIRVALVTGVLLLVPLVAMRISDDVVWGPVDFVTAGGLLFGTGLAYVLVAGRGGTLVYRAAVGVALGTALFLVWANLAVGIIGNEGNPANLAYYGVLAVGFIGALIARLKPQGMARALFVAAIAQGSVAAAALIAGLHRAPESSVPEILAVNGFFVVLWAGSALLFRRAAR